jgi:hypothetical protein
VAKTISTMKKYLAGFFYSLPVQLLLLHFRRNQVLLVFWYILFATVSGNFLQAYGASSLFLAPEYLDNVNALSTAIVGFAIAIFIMSWNITTFILLTRYIKFLATTAQPFLKYCINNAVIPLVFLVVYLIYGVHYAGHQELMDAGKIAGLAAGFLGGLVLSVTIAAVYFFGADKTIYRRMHVVLSNASTRYERSAAKKRRKRPESDEIRVDWFLSARLSLRKPRIVKHYSQYFLDTIFKRHHIAAVLIVLLAFIFLITVGIFSDYRVMQFPAAASIAVFFAILIAAAGAITLFLKSWSIPSLIVMYVFINWMYQQNIIDPRNKAYGLNYGNKNERPAYGPGAIKQLAVNDNTEADRKVYESMLATWKQRQGAGKPVLFIINVSGGGLRSAAFTMNVLQMLDSITNGAIMKHTVLMTGASGGMLGAGYFRQLYWEKLKGDITNVRDKKYVDDISKDLLNPLFASFVSRDLIGPAKKFKAEGNYYTKDRGFAFEQKLNENTHGLLDKRVNDYTAPEEQAVLPCMLFNSTINRDGRAMVIATHPARFLMQQPADSNSNIVPDPDMVDFVSLFKQQSPQSLGVLSALRMNASFPYVLPNVWLPTDPVIDVMDAGLRDNAGLAESMRYLNTFKDWLRQNTSKVVLVEIRDRELSNWDDDAGSNDFFNFILNPFLLLQNNWYKLQDYGQNDASVYLAQQLGPMLNRVLFEYRPGEKHASASLSFHLTAAEKVDIAAALYTKFNQQSFEKIKEVMK